MTTKAQKAHALASYFKKKHKEALRLDYRGNAHREKWGFQDMLDDVESEERARKIIDWFFKTQRRDYSAQDLFKNYDKILEQMLDDEEDKRNTMELLEATRKKVEEARRARGIS